MLLTIVEIILLLVANGFFVAAEFAIVKVRGIRIEALADQGNLAARMSVRILRNVEAYLSACQLGITMASLGLGWIGEPAVSALLEPILHPLGLGAAMVHTISFLLGFLLFSSLSLAAALLSAESGVQAFALFLAYTVVRERGNPRRCVAGLIAPVLLLAVYLCAWALFGFGTTGTPSISAR